MFQFCAEKNKLNLCQREPLTSGSRNVYEVRFQFSPDWDGLEKAAVFQGGGEPVSVLLGESGTCQIPWEALAESGVHLRAGVCGVYGGVVVLPTVWADCGYILRGAGVSEEDCYPPTPELWEQVLAGKQDKLTGAPGQVVGFDESGNAGAQDMMGGGTAYKFGHGFKREGLELSVDAVDGFDGDNTLPITAAAVQAAVGNIQLLLETI